MARPNLLLVTADQWRGDCLGLAGHPVVATPGIDRLAAGGVAFLAHYAQASPCSPSRASLYTGLYQMNHRVVRNGTPLDRRHDNLALAMRRAGYAPTLFGYTDQSADPRDLPSDSPWLRTYEGILPGFDVGVRLSESAEPWLDWLREQGVAAPANVWDLYRPASGATARPSTLPPAYSADQTETAFLAGRFLDWLATRDREPWFAHVSFLRPHPPFIVPAPYNTLYDPGGGPAFRRAASREAEARQHPLLAHWQATGATSGSYVAGSVPPAQWTDADFRTVRALYLGMIAEVDRQIGRILDGLAAAGFAEDTIVVFTSDHGEMLGDHWMVGKYGYFDQAYHVPLVIRDPRKGYAHARRVDAFTEAVDLMPTLLALVGAEPPSHLDGRSLEPFLIGSTPAGWRDAAHFEFDFRDAATGEAQGALGLDLDACSLAVHREKRFKYVHFAGLKPLLFDLANDPAELVDVSDEPAYAGVRLACAEKLLSWRARHLDRTLTGIELTANGPVDARRSDRG